MTPDQLRQLAMRIRARYPRPVATMRVTTYLSCEAMHAVADALDEQARDEDALAEHGPE